MLRRPCCAVCCAVCKECEAFDPLVVVGGGAADVTPAVASAAPGLVVRT